MVTTTPLDELFSQQRLIKDRVRGIIHRQSNGMYLYGRPGTSKSHTIHSTLDMNAVGYTSSSGHLTPIGLLDLIDENQDRILVLDDVSAIFNQPIALQILLAALGNPYDGAGVRLVKYKTAKETRVVPFSGGIICMSNLALDGHHNEVLAALRDRIFVINYEPSDEQIIAPIHKLADGGIGGVPPDKAKMVALHLVEQCKVREIRPSIRLFVDKAIKDFKLWESGNCEAHWRDLVNSNLEQQMIELQHGTRDLGRAEQIEAERRIALNIFFSYETRDERVQAWEQRTGKSQAALYRRFKELKADGKMDVGV